MPFSRELLLDVLELPTWVIGFALASLIAAAAYRLGSLSASGAISSVIAGTAAVGAGWSWAIVLLTYFVLASALSRVRAADKAAASEGRIEKGGARDAIQVAANGGVFVMCAIAYWMSPHGAWQAIGAAALAASSADTWATEIGTLSKARPRSILDGRIVPVGTSGGVTLLGFMAGVTGALVVAGVALAAGWPLVTAVAALVGGVSGSAADSLLGATLQARRWCPTCGAETERRVHTCDTETEVRGGLAWLDNDGVNALSTFDSALLGAGLWYILR